MEGRVGEVTEREWQEYYRRLALREARKREVEERLQWSDAPGRAWSREAARRQALVIKGTDGRARRTAQVRTKPGGDQ
jgi:hypothetical protein